MPESVNFGFALESEYPTDVPKYYGTTTLEDLPEGVMEVTEDEYSAAQVAEAAAMLAKTKSEILTGIDGALTNAQNRLKAAYSKVEIETWDQQKAEAEAYSADASASTPLVDALVKASGEDKADIIAGILAKAALYAAASGANLGRMRALKALVNVEKITLAELARIRNDELYTGWVS
jgi:hypothetical protein